MRKLLLIGLLLILPSPSNAAPTCAVHLESDRLSMAPLRYVRAKVTIERHSARSATFAVVDALGPVRSSELQTNVRTQWVEYKNIVLGAGNYEVVVATSSGCVARDQFTVR